MMYISKNLKGDGASTSVPPLRGDRVSTWKPRGGMKRNLLLPLPNLQMQILPSLKGRAGACATFSQKMQQRNMRKI